MVPSDYRLDHVVARLIERLEGMRASFPDDSERAMVAFRRTAEEQVDAAIAEFMDIAEDAEPHATFLRREVLETFLPRYHRLATEMTRREEGAFGFGPLADPVGRLALVGAALLILWLVLLRLLALPVVWPIVLLDLSMVFWPDLAAWLHRRRYLAQLERVVSDMVRIQEQTRAYLPSYRGLERSSSSPIESGMAQTESHPLGQKDAGNVKVVE